MVNGPAKTPSKGEGRRSTRGGRGVRSESPAKSPTKKTPARKIATPRKTRKGRGKSTEPDAVNGDAEDTVKVEIETEHKPTLSGDEEVERTKVNIEMPAGSPDLELPQDAEGMLAKAREMVAEAEKISGPSAAKGKRKATDLDDAGIESPLTPAKRAKTMELELRKERIKRRALTGIAASLAIGYVYPRTRTLDFGY